VGRLRKIKSLIVEEANRRLLNEQQDNISCSEAGCKGIYKGPEFNSSGDIAHQFSNKMSYEVGNKLKELYSNQTYVVVDMDNIKMTTLGMGTGNVVYTLDIPFIRVQEPCQGYTSFDHVGGWGHTPALDRRKQELSSALLPGDEFNISKLLKTREGLQEYWIQWRNNKIQATCGGTSKVVKKTITGSDLDDFKNKIRQETLNKTIDLESITFDMDSHNMTYNEGSGDQILRLTLTYNLPGEKDCPSCTKVINDNTDYDAKVIREGRFENNTRIYNLIVLYPK